MCDGADVDRWQDKPDLGDTPDEPQSDHSNTGYFDYSNVSTDVILRLVARSLARVRFTQNETPTASEDSSCYLAAPFRRQLRTSCPTEAVYPIS